MDTFSSCELPSNQSLKLCNHSKMNALLDKAIRQSKIIVGTNPENAENWALYGTLLFRKYQYNGSADLSLKDAALSAAKHSLMLNPTNPVFADNIGLVYFDNKNYPEALTYWLRAYLLKPDYHPTLSHLKDIYQKLGESKKSEYYDSLLNR